ncbi:MAG: TrkA family potassium uptake protein [Candidatus Methanomethylicia archaeon]
MRILIVGAGDVGKRLTKILTKGGNEVVVIDRDKRACDIVAGETDALVLNREATDLNVYEEIEIDKFDIVLALTNRDEVNLFVCMVAKNYGVPRIISLVEDEKIAEFMSGLGVEKPLCKPKLVANTLSNIIEGRRGVAEIFEVEKGSFKIVAVDIGEHIVGKTLRELNIPLRAKIISVFNGEEFIDPDPDYTLKYGDMVIALVHVDDIRRLEDTLR